VVAPRRRVVAPRVIVRRLPDIQPKTIATMKLNLRKRPTVALRTFIQAKVLTQSEGSGGRLKLTRGTRRTLTLTRGSAEPGGGSQRMVLDKEGATLAVSVLVLMATPVTMVHALRAAASL
jgi:hypothetical protein